VDVEERDVEDGGDLLSGVRGCWVVIKMRWKRDENFPETIPDDILEGFFEVRDFNIFLNPHSVVVL